MLKKFLLVSGVLLLLVGCVTTEPDDPNRVQGEYTITLRPHALGSRPIELLYKPYGITEIKDLGNGKYLVRMSKDPGPKTVQKLAAESAEVESVQPSMKPGAKK